MVVVAEVLAQGALEQARHIKVLTEGLEADQREAQLVEQETHHLRHHHKVIKAAMLTGLQRIPVVAGVVQLVLVQMLRPILVALVELELPHLSLGHQ